MITIKDIARQCGKSPATVSRALNNSEHISDNVKRSIRELAEKLDYRPNLQAQSLKNKRTGILGCVGRTFAGVLDVEIIKGVDSAAEKNGFSLLLCILPDENAERIRLYRNLLNQPFFDGLLATIPAPGWFHAHTIHKPLVYIDQWPTDNVDKELSVATSDHWQANQLIFGFFRDQQANQVIYYGHGKNNSVEKTRFDLARKMARTGNIQFDRIAPTHENLSAYLQARVQDANACRTGLIIEPPHIIGPSNNPFMTSFLSSCVSASFDPHQFPQPAKFKKALLITQDHRKMGEVAVEMMLDKLNKKKISRFGKVPVSAQICH